MNTTCTAAIPRALDRQPTTRWLFYFLLCMCHTVLTRANQLETAAFCILLILGLVSCGCRVNFSTQSDRPCSNLSFNCFYMYVFLVTLGLYRATVPMQPTPTFHTSIARVCEFVCSLAVNSLFYVLFAAIVRPIRSGYLSQVGKNQSKTTYHIRKGT